MPTKNLQSKKYTSDYLSQVVKLLNVCFPKNKITQESFLWKHYDSFFHNKASSLLAIDKTKVCAYVCFSPIAIIQNQKKIPAFYSCAVQATHPDYQRQGIISHLTQEIEKDLGPNTNYLGFSNEEGIKIDKFSKKINYQIVGQMIVKYFFSLPYKTNITLEKTNNLPADVKTTSKHFRILKDKSYLNWRYENNPKNKYFYLKITKQGKNQGYIVYKKGKFKHEISELLFAKSNAKICKDTLKAFAKFSFYKGKPFTIYKLLPNKFWLNGLLKLSFTKKINTHFTIKSLNNKLLDSNNWFIQGGDIQ